MNGQVLAIAVLAAVAAWLPRARAWCAPRPGSAVRLAPYTERARGRLGTAARHATAGARSAWGPMITAAADRLGRRAGQRLDGELELRLRRAGLGHDDRRPRTAAANSPTPSSGSSIGVALGVAAAAVDTTLALVVAGVGRRLSARSAWRAKVDGLIDDRQHRDASRGPHRLPDARRVAAHRRHPAGALDRLAQRTTGIVPGELAEAAAQIRSGSPPVEVLERLATPDRRAVRRPPLPPLRRHLGRRRRPGRRCSRCPTACAPAAATPSPARWPAAASRWRCRSSP